MKLVLASNNAKKLAELGQLFAPLGIELVTQGSLGVGEAEEPHHTFVENGLAKARHAAAVTGLPAIADDSGLCVDALGGEPGVQSAVFAPFTPDPGMDREAQRRAQDAANNRLLLDRLAGATDRRASFVCSLIALRSANDPEPLIAFGRWNGEIVTAPREDRRAAPEILELPRGAGGQQAGPGGVDSQGGFGYDPLMFIPGLGKTVATLPSATKNANSHRAIAAAQMIALMRTAWHL